MTVENQELDETELFNNAVSDEPVETIEQPVTETEQDQATTAETGQEATAEQTGDKPPIPPKPEWRLREDAERARAAEAELANERAEKAALRQRLEALERPAPRVEATKPTRPDPLLDPDGYAAAIRQELREEALNERREESLQQAAEADPENFKAAYALAQQRVDPALKARMQESRNPGKTLLSWYREQKTMQEVGNDPKAWLEKQIEERFKDPAFLAKAVEAAQNSARQPSQQTSGRSRVELPPSLSSASRSNAAARTDSTDVSDAELFRETTG